MQDEIQMHTLTMAYISSKKMSPPSQVSKRQTYLLLDLGDFCGRDCLIDLPVGTLGEGQKSTSDGGVFENATGDKGMLESDGALHVRATVVDSGGDGKELIVDSPSLLVVLSFTGVEELKEKFGSDTTVTDEHTVDVESSVEEVFVVASEDVGVGSCLPDDGDLSVPSSHISDTILH